MSGAGAGLVTDLRRLLGREPKALPLFALSLVAGALAGACTSGMVALVHRLVKGGAAVSDPVLSFFALWLGHGLFGVLSAVALGSLLQGVMLGLRMQLSTQLLATPLKAIEEIGQARLLSMFTHTIDSAVHALEGLPGMVSRLALLCGLYAYLAWIEPSFFAAFMAFLFLGIGLYLVPTALYRRFQVKRLQAQDAHLGHFHALVQGIKELLQHRAKQRALLERLLRPSGENLRRVWTRSILFDASLNRWGEMYAMLGVAGMLFLLPEWLAVSGARVGDFLLILLLSLAPLSTVIGFSFKIQELRAALGQLKEIGWRLEEPRPVHRPEKPHGDGGLALQFSQVEYAYYHAEKDERFNLGPLSFAIESPGVLIVTGGNGSGKSTLAKLLCGLYTPEAGTILLNGQPVEEDRLEEYRQLFSVVFPDFFLFDTLLGLEDRDVDAEANTYLRRLKLGHKVEVRHGAFSSTRLSQGQKKRLALLSAYLEHRPVCVFDEWAADQDPEFKELFYREIVPQLKARGKIVVIVSHDDSYFDIADRIVTLRDGQLLPPVPPADGGR